MESNDQLIIGRADSAGQCHQIQCYKVIDLKLFRGITWVINIITIMYYCKQSNEVGGSEILNGNGRPFAMHLRYYGLQVDS